MGHKIAHFIKGKSLEQLLANCIAALKYSEKTEDNEVS